VATRVTPKQVRYLEFARRILQRANTNGANDAEMDAQIALLCKGQPEVIRLRIIELSLEV
jgi:hypothetical protein